MPKILIIRLTSLGDVIFTIPLACCLKDSDKNVKIGWVVAEKGLGVIKNNPCIDTIHFVPLNEWKKRPFSIKTLKEFIQILKEIRKENYDIALDCQQMFKNLLLFMFCKAKRRITFKDARELSFLGANEFVTPKAKFRDNNYHIVERNLDLARHLGIEPKEIKFSLPPTTPKAKEYIDELLISIDKTKPIVVISPATTWENKHWDEENWAKLINEIKDKTNLVFTGTKQDNLLIEKIIEKTKKQKNEYLNLAGKTNVEELLELFSRSNIVISPDSGSAHLAWASQNPKVVTIFTCTPPKRFGPYNKSNDKYFSIIGNLQCQPCFKKKCKVKSNINQCTKLPSANEIINIVNNFI